MTTRIGLRKRFERFVAATYLRNVMWCVKRGKAIETAALWGAFYAHHLVDMYVVAAVLFVGWAVAWFAGLWQVSATDWLFISIVCVSGLLWFFSARAARRVINSFRIDELLEQAQPYGSPREQLVRWLQVLALFVATVGLAILWGVANRT